MRLLTFTSLYPYPEKPSHGIFVETRLRHLLASGQAESRVVAPVPWFPVRHPAFGRYASFARIPRRECRHGIDVVRPRFASIPRVGMGVAPILLAAGARRCVGNILDAHGFDVIDAHYFYPDGVAAAMLGRYFNKPVVITARGSDIGLIPAYPLARRQIVWAARQARGLVAVCDALRVAMVRLGIPAAKIGTLRNGVDLALFRPVERDAVRAHLDIAGYTLLAVGNLVPLKGHELMIEALPLLPDVRLLIAGAGPLQRHLEAAASRLGVAGRVRFLGALPQDALRGYYGAADALLLASSSEGWANVLLESMACGTPVVAPRVGGIPEVVADPAAGLLYRERTGAAIAEAVRQLRASQPDRDATRRYAERFSWDETTRGQLRLFRSIVGAPA
jgi:teichuronic acid biosynthesis glycosyltransferase TuaC